MNRTPETIIYKPKRPRPSMDAVLLTASGIGTGLMAGIAMHALLPEAGAFTWAKAGLIAVLAGGVAYAVNRFAVERGAPLAATGYLTAGLMSVGSILFIGAGLFASTYAGMTLSFVSELQLHDYGKRLETYASSQIRDITKSTRAIPVIELTRDDLRSKAACEITTSCVSGNGTGGRGPVARTLEVIAERADGIASKIAAGESERQDLQKQIADYLAEYHRVLGDTNAPLGERRRKLIVIDSKIDQALATLSEAIPLPLLEAYATELKQGVAIEGGAASPVNALLGKHGRSLSDVLDTLESAPIEEPEFPANAGVSSTFEYIWHFLPIAAITAVVELVLPIALWVYTFIGIVWDKAQILPQPAGPTPRREKRVDTKGEAGSRGKANRHSHKRMNGRARRKPTYFDPTEDDISDYLANAGRGLKGDQ